MFSLNSEIAGAVASTVMFAHLGEPSLKNISEAVRHSSTTPLPDALHLSSPFTASQKSELTLLLATTTPEARSLTSLIPVHFPEHPETLQAVSLTEYSAVIGSFAFAKFFERVNEDTEGGSESIIRTMLLWSSRFLLSS